MWPDTLMWKAWIPNGLSLGNLSFGFLAIVVASHASTSTKISSDNIYLISGMLILIAALFDGLDGPMARMLNVQSTLGEQLDSLGDLTTFGLAPGFLMYKMYLADFRFAFENMGSQIEIPLGMIVAVIYPICAAYRLARFNVTHDTNSFVGLPSPIAGVFIALIAISFQSYPLSRWLAISIFLLMAFLMVSNIRYTKPQVSLKSHFTYFRLILFSAVIVLSMVFLGWYWVIFSVIMLYIFSGFIALGLELVQKVKWAHHHEDKP